MTQFVVVDEDNDHDDNLAWLLIQMIFSGNENTQKWVRHSSH
jgi:hypothetical protein